MSRPPALYGHPGMREVAVPVATMWTSPDAPRAVDADAVRDMPDVAGWAAAMGSAARLGLHGRALTQLLMGEPALVLEERDGWARVAALWQESATHERGYAGWVRTAHLAEPVRRTEGPTAFVTSREATCTLDGGGSVTLSFGTALWADPGREGLRVLVPGGGAGTLSARDVRLSDKVERPRLDADRILEVAAAFLGLRYLWGGTSTWGLDCSGLVHLALRSQGVLLPRDACDQARSHLLEAVPLDQVRPGDLYFFARPGERIYHVGFVSRPPADDGTRWMLHAPEGGGLVEDAPLAPHRQQTLVSAARLLGG